MSIWGFFSNKIPYKLHWVIWPQIMRTYFVSMIFALSPETKHGYFSIYTKISFVGELEEKLLLSWNTKLIHCYPQPHSDIFTYFAEKWQNSPKINFNKITNKGNHILMMLSNKTYNDLYHTGRQTNVVAAY